MKIGDQVRHVRLGWRGVVSAIVTATPLSGPHRPYIVRRVTAYRATISAHAADDLEPLIDASFLSVEDTIDTAPSATVLPFARPKLRLVRNDGGDSATMTPDFILHLCAAGLVAGGCLMLIGAFVLWWQE